MKTNRRHWLWLLLAAVVAITLAHALDEWAWRALRDAKVNDRDWGRLLRSMGYLPLWLVLGLGLWLQRRGVPDAGRQAGIVALAPALGGLAAEIGKLLIRRLRPDAELFGYAFRPFAEDLTSTRGLGMPSSHVAVAFAGAAVLARLYPRAAGLWYLLAAGCAATRVLALGHFVSDTVAAACLGWAVTAVLWTRVQRGASLGG